MTDITNNTPSSETDALDIFEKQREQFTLTEEETEYIKKLGLDDIDLSETDLSFDDEPLYILENMSLEDCLDLNDTPDYCNSAVADDYTKAEIVSCCLDALYDHIGTNSIDENMINLNEKLLCFAQGADLVNAITCMGLQLAEYNRNKEDDNPLDLPGDAGAILNFYSNLAVLVSDWEMLDADAQTTLAHEAHLVENDMYAAENTMYNFSGILDRVKDADSYLPQEGEYMYKPGLTEISANVVKMHYQEIFYAFDKIYNKLSIFMMKLLEGDIELDESGKYNRQKSVFFMAKEAAFGQGDYELPGDEYRVYEYKEKSNTSAEAKAKPEDKPKDKKAKKKTKSQKLAEKRAAKYEKADAEPENETEENSTVEIKADEAVEEVTEKAAEKPAVAQEVRDAMAEYLTFFKKVNDITDESKLNIMIATCKEQLKEKQDNFTEEIDYAEKLLTLDNRNENFITMYYDLSMGLIFKTANSEGKFKGTLSEKLQYAKEVKAKTPNKPGIANTLLLPKVGLLLTVALFIVSLMIPVTFIQSVIGGLVKIIVVLLGLALLITTGPFVLFFLPIFILIALTVFNLVGNFINPFLLVKIVLVVIIGALAALQAKDISADMRSLQWQYDRYVSIKKECLPIAEKLLSICKERNMPDEIMTYYERLKSAFEEL